MKTLRNFIVTGGLLRSNGDEAQVGDSVELFLLNGGSFTGIIQFPISPVNCGKDRAYVIQYDYESVVRPCDLEDGGLVMDCCALLEANKANVDASNINVDVWKNILNQSDNESNNYISNEIELRTTLIESSHFTGDEPVNSRDDNENSTWAGNTPGDEWLGIDAGEIVNFTRVSIMPRSGDGGTDFEASQIGVKLQVANSSDFSDAETVEEFYEFPHKFRFNYSDIAINKKARYARLLGPNGSLYQTWAEVHWFASYADSATGRPCPPRISPAGGRYPENDALVTMSSDTASASIYYTTNNTTPTTSSTEYKGPFVVPAGSTLAIRAISVDPSLSITTSRETEVYFQGFGLAPSSDWYDNRGILLEAHSGSIVDDRNNTGFYYWTGNPANCAQKTSYPDVMNTRGVMLYRSKDLLNWEFVRQILPLPNGCTGFVRPHILWCESTKLWVLWGHGYVIDGDAGSSAIAVSNNIENGWTWVNHDYRIADETGLEAKLLDLYPVKDGDNAYLFYVDSAGGGQIYLRKLSWNFLSVESTAERITVTNSGLREAPAVFKKDGRWFCINSITNYYGLSGAFDLRVTSALSLSGPWSSNEPLFDTSPFGTDYEGQSAFVLEKDGNFIVGIDHWSPTQLYASRQVWLPLEFPTSSTCKAVKISNWIP